MNSIELVLFASEPEAVERALKAGLTSLMTDWEWRGKDDRQSEADTEINREGPAELAGLLRLEVPRRHCRINRAGPWTPDEVEAAIDAGATEIFLPMVSSPAEVDEFLSRLRGRCRCGILVETEAAVRAAEELARRPLDRVYVGLNDLAIERRSPSLFDAISDGTVERLRDQFRDPLFGFGGVTTVDGGDPVPCRLLLTEMAALGCDFSFMRRSFRRDVAGRDMKVEVARIAEIWQALRRRGPLAVERDRRRLRTLLVHTPVPFLARPTPSAHANA